jgi:hypothetical protein
LPYALQHPNIFLSSLFHNETLDKVQIYGLYPQLSLVMPIFGQQNQAGVQVYDNDNNSQLDFHQNQ